MPVLELLFCSPSPGPCGAFAPQVALGPRSFWIVVAPRVAVRVCLGDLAVPLAPASVKVDGGPVDNEGEPQELRVQELDLSRRLGSFEWIESALGLRARSFRAASWPLVEEILEQLGARRAQMARRAAKQPGLVVQLLVRGRHDKEGGQVKSDLSRVRLVPVCRQPHESGSKVVSVWFWW